MLLVLLACETPTEDVATKADPTLDDAPLTVTFDDASTSPLVEDAAAAVALAPAWLRGDLALAFAQQESDEQEGLAAVLLDLADPALIDEVAFAMAHTSSEVLAARKFYPQLLVENAQRIYDVDPLLDYVRLVEVGEPGVDDDWYTTTAYQVMVDGLVEEVTLDRDVYYWFVVHPRIEDEHPWYVDAWDACTRDDLECHTTPESGTFWRSFLWSEAAESCPEGESCPVLAEYLPGETVLWGDPDGDDAVHAIAAFMLSSPGDVRWFDFGAYGERSIQPNRIYALGRGNCGEWADMTSALSRTALIPNVNVTPSSWDHTWNAFFQDDWIPWEPVNWAFDPAYGSGYATYGTRGDTSIFYQSEDYTSTVADLQVVVRDAAGMPVDGAAVAIWSPYEGSWWYAGEQGTGADGVATFRVGADKEFAFAVRSALGEFPGDGYIDQATAGIPVGEVAVVDVALDGALPTAPVPAVVAVAGDMHVAATVAVEGRTNTLSMRFDEQSTAVTPAPTLDSWVMSEADYAAFVAGEEFQVAAEGLAADLPTGSRWVLVVANLRSQNTAVVGTLAGTAEVAGGRPVALERDLVLLPGKHVAIGISGG